jgi:anti-sigma regulatory factor (Ser/Thr protein kinase)
MITESDEPDGEPAEREFLLDPHEVSEVRAWVLKSLPRLCDLREDVVLAVSEIVGNATRHGHALGKGRVTIEHGADELWCEVFEPGPLRGRVRADPAALEEMAALAGLVDGAEIEVGGLLEAGRGLPLVRALCADRFTIVETAEGRWIRFGLSGCLCQIRDPPPRRAASLRATEVVRRTTA